MTTSSSSSEQPNDLLTPLLAPLSSPSFIGCFGLFVLVLLLSLFTKRRPQFSDGRFATASEVRKGRKLGLRQIASGQHNKAALSLSGKLVLCDLQPAVAVVGRSRGGKTRSIVDPGLKNAIEQGWTLMVLDVKGNLMQKHSAYAISKGYDVYVLAPGFPYSDGLNPLDFMESPSDAKAGLEVGKVLNRNFSEPGARKDAFFDPQKDALLKAIFMLAKESPYPDLLSAWKLLSLDNLASRLAAAKKYGLFDGGAELNSWIGESAMGLRSVHHAEETSVGIVGSAVTHFQNLIDPSILPCLLESTIPLDLPGKQIVFFQIDEQNEAATSPLVAVAIHMLAKRNLNATVKRDRPLGLFLDEFASIRLPDIESWINRFAEYGLVCVLGYQSDSQVEMRYSRDYTEAILSSCGTKIIFNTGHPQTADKFSKSLGEIDVWYQSQSWSSGKNSSSSRSEQVQKVPLLTGAAINRMKVGESVILSPGMNFRPLKLKIPINWQDDVLWKRCSQIWQEKICPFLIEQAEKRLEGISIEIGLGDRDLLAMSMLPTAEELEALKKLKELRK